MRKNSQKFRYLPHPADLKIQAFGQSPAELFQNAALAMMNFLFDLKSAEKKILKKEKIKIKSTDSKSLLVDWLAELLYLTDTNNLAYSKFKFNKLTETELETEIFGLRATAKNDIKAVTYHQLEVKKNNGGWQAIVLFDI